MLAPPLLLGGTVASSLWKSNVFDGRGSRMLGVLRPCLVIASCNLSSAMNCDVQWLCPGSFGQRCQVLKKDHMEL
jgi:hypothetical protein